MLDGILSDSDYEYCIIIFWEHESKIQYGTDLTMMEI